MLKIRTFILALSLAPLLSVAWQLPNQAQVSSPSKGSAATPSGGGTTGSSGTVFSAPPISTNIAPLAGASPSVTVSTGAGGVINIVVAPAASNAVNAAAAAILLSPVNNGGGTTNNGGGTTNNGGGTTNNGGGTTNNGGGTTNNGGGTTNNGGGTTNNGGGTANNGGGTADNGGGTADNGGGTADNGGGGQGAATVVALVGGGAGAQVAAAQVTSALTGAGVSPTLATALVQAFASIFSFSGASKTPSFPSAQLPQEQPVASNKALKAGLTIAQNNAAPTVNINKLNDAINAYNQIVLESSPVALQKLAQDPDFVAIGTTLKKLRAAIK
jgi:hypothetical protein